MSGENKQKEDVNVNPLVESVFKPPIATIFVHSENQQVLAYIVVCLQRFLGKENIQQLQPYFNDKRKTWGVQVLIKKFPKILANAKSYTAKEVIKGLEPPEEPPMDKEV
jgi:hypothetical protein